MVLPSKKTSINEHNTQQYGGTLVSPPSTYHGPYKCMTLGHYIMPAYKSAIKLQHHTNSNYNIATTTRIALGNPAVKHYLCQRYIHLLKAPKTRIKCQQSMDHTFNMIQMIETMKGMFWYIKHHGDVSIAICASADMERLTEFYDMVAHPALLNLPCPMLPSKYALHTGLRRSHVGYAHWIHINQ
jgi:hypothetical protein